MRRLQQNLAVGVSVFALAIVLALTVGALAVPEVRTDLARLQWMTYATLGGVVAAISIGTMALAWSAVWTVREQQRVLDQRMRELAALNELFQRHLKETEVYRKMEAAVQAANLQVLMNDLERHVDPADDEGDSES